MAKIDEVLAQVKILNVKLYGENGFEGDIPQIKATFKEFKKEFRNHSKRIRKLEIIIGSLVVLSGGSFGLIKLLGG